MKKAMWVKICANTNLDDALLATESGVDALGFVFAASRRKMNADQVRTITSQLPPAVERVGVFAGQSAEEILEITSTAGLTAVQLHDGFDAQLTEYLRGHLSPAVALIQTVPWTLGVPAQAEKVSHDLEQILQHTEGQVERPRVLVDAKLGETSGGLGVSFDWNEAQPVFASFSSRLRLILAGGLRPESVSAAIRCLRPWGVDVASGVEAQPGRKDPLKLQEFVRRARHPSDERPG